MANLYCVYDFETGGINPLECEMTQLAAVILNSDTLDIVPGGMFDSGTVRVENPKNIEQGALDVTGKTREEIAAGRDPKQVIKEFVDFIYRYNPSRSMFSAPIRCGHNILKFDDIIITRYCQKYNVGYNRVKNQLILFNPRDFVDIQNLAFLWFHGLPEPKSYSMDSLRDFFGLKKQGAHEALMDVKQEAILVKKFLLLHRNIALQTRFAGACTNV